MRQHTGKVNKLVVALGAATGLALAVPTATLALPGLLDSEANPAAASTSFANFTPASVDPELAQRVSQRVSEMGLAARFTPAGSLATDGSPQRTVTVAIRVDDQTARAISVRTAVASAADAQAGAGPSISKTVIAPSRYNLGIARGYQGFAKAPEPVVERSRGLGLPDMGAFSLNSGQAADKPSRFQPRIALENDRKAGRSPQTLDSLGDQSVDVGGAFRVTRNLDVTAGVRLSQDRDRLDPLTDDVQDSQAVYVGTQLRF